MGSSVRGYDAWKTRSNLDDWAAQNHREWIDGPPEPEEEPMPEERKDRVLAYVNGRLMPTTMNLQKLAKALDTTPEALLADTYENASVTMIDDSPPEERRADIEGKLVELEHEIALAVRQGVMKDKHTWMATFPALSTPGKPEEGWIAVLTMGKV